MHTEELVRCWKQPGARRGTSVVHPSGEIALRPAGRLARRHALTADLAGFTLMTLTQSCPLAPEPISE